MKSPSASSVIIVGEIPLSEKCQPEQQSAHHDDHFLDPTTNYCRWVEDICIPMIIRFDRFLILFSDLECDIMRLNGEFELQLTIEDVYDQMPSSIASANQFSMIEVFGNTRKKEVKLDNPLSFDQCYISSVSLYAHFVLYHVLSDQVIVINTGSTPQEVLIPRDAYDIERIIAKLNASDAFPVRIGVLWRERIPYHCEKLLHD